METADTNFHDKPTETTVVTGSGASNVGAPSKPGFDPRNRHPDYIANEQAWRTSRDVYLGAEGMEPRAKEYLPQRQRGEHDTTYEERLKLAHFSGLLGVLVDSIIGLWARKSPEEDTWGVLGEIGGDGELLPGTMAAKLVKDADREGTSWDNHRRARATWMLTYRRCYTYIDTNRADVAGGLSKAQARAMNVRPFATILSPLDVLDWVEVDGRKVDVVIQEGVDPRTDLNDGEGRVEDRYLRLRREGWSRYRVEKRGESSKPVLEASGSYVYFDREGRRAIPLVECELPMPRYATYNLALIVLAIINHDSYLDNLLRAGALAQKLVVQGDSEEVQRNVSEGDSVLAYPMNATAPQFIAFLMDAATPIEGRIEKLTEYFWRAAMYEFSDRPREKTATEVDQAWAAGVGAFLTLIAGASEEAENEEKWFLAQAFKAADVNGRVDPESAGFTKFAREYRVEDVIAELSRLKELVFGIGESLPLGPGIRSAVTEYILKRLDDQAGLLSEAEGLDVKAEVEAKVAEEELDRERMRTLTSEIGKGEGFEEEGEGGDEGNKAA